MGAPKQKWTPEEEAALRAGVEKYGQGKWRAIQKDPEYGPVLTSRSNVDLKDKWRNLSVQAGYPRSGIKPKKEGGDSLNVFGEVSNFPAPISPTETVPHSYDDIILEAISTLKHPNGSNVTAIAAFIEERRNTPPNLRKVLPSKLKSLVAQGRLVRVDQNYKLFTGHGHVRPRPESDDDEMAEMKPHTKRARIDVEAAMLKIQESEEKAFAAAKALTEAETASSAAEAAWRAAERAEREAETAHIAAKVAIHHVRTLQRNNNVQNFNQSPKVEVPVG